MALALLVGVTGCSSGATSALCGNSGACLAGQVCVGECFGDGSPWCAPLATACDSASPRVCGCDGRTYANECVLQRAAIAKDHDGQCVFTDIPGDVSLLTGVWSGTGVRMNVTPTGAAISIGCASGTIDEPLNVTPRSYTVAGPLPRYGSWQGTFSGVGVAPVNVTYEARLSGATLMLGLMDQSWMLRYEDKGAPTCP
jgi:hypothetical protein